MNVKKLRKLSLLSIIVLLNAFLFQVTRAVPGSITTLFAHDNRQFHGNMFDVTVVNPLSITGFDVNLTWGGDTTVTVFYRNGTYVGSETTPGDWTLLGSATVTSQGPNTATYVPITSGVLPAGDYGFYVRVPAIFEINTGIDMHYTSGSNTYSNSDISIITGIGVGGDFGDPDACNHWSRNYPLTGGACIFLDRMWNGTIYYDTEPAVAPTITSAAPGNGTDGVAYNHTYTATGSSPITYSVTAGALPTGLTLSTAGVISGTPTVPGNYTGTVTATNGTAPNATQNFNITIAAVAPSITSAAPGNGTDGVAYNHTYTATGSATITYSVTAGALPTGLTLSTAGVISGTPTVPGNYTGTVTATNGAAPDATQNFNITIAAVPPTITSAAPGNGTDGVAYNHSYTATGSATITYSVTAGALPTGLTLSTAGVISGTPTVPGNYTGTVTATNGAAPDATQNFNITIAAVPPTITSAAPGNGTDGVAYNHSYTAVGSATITYSVTAGALPTGLTLSTAGVISGTPTVPGNYTGTVTATNGAAPDATQNFNITIAAVPPTITSAAPGNGTDGVAYNHTYTATGSATITYSVTAGALPTGLTLSTAGVISGTPTVPGNYTGTVTATNGAAPDATQNFNITIGGIAPVITSGAPGDGTESVAYNHSYTATGSATITYSVTAGALPTGLTLSTAGVISGTPTVPGNYTGTVTATNGAAPDATQNFNITIAAVPPTITSAAPSNGTDGVAYNHTYTATGTSPITYSVTAGALPTGLTLSTAGVISGTPTVPGNYTGTVTATNGAAPDATQNFNITIAAVPPTITSAAPGNGTDSVAYNHTYTATGSATITYSVTAGALPTGLTLSTAGVISGTPTVPGNYTGTVTATNGASPDATQNFNITIAAVAPTITSAAPSNGTDGVAYNHTYTATGSATITYSVTAGALPTGLTLSTAGVISGTPTVPGNYTGTVTATNGAAPDATQNFNITIGGIAPVITSGAPGDGTESVAYNHTYTATGSATITYSVTAGALPTGLTLSAAGVISGTPTTAGNYTGTVTATNGAAPDATQNFNITIAVPTAAPVITSAAPIDGTESVAYSHTYTATGTLPITYSVTAGALPTGLTLSSAGVISGTPTAVGTYTGTVTATNGTLPDATQNFTIVIGTVPVAPAVVELPAAPPAPLCTNVNFDENAGLRAHAPFDSMEVNCRMLIENGQYFNWNGGPLTNAGQIGNQSVLDLGVTQAVDVFSPVGRAQFEGDVVICLRGTGTLIYFNANQSPRTPQVITGWTTPAFPGFTCGTLYQPGTLVLVSRPPQ